MNIFRYDKHCAELGACPFCEAYNDDLWVVYHGTSNHNEGAIEGGGFGWSGDTYSKAEIDSVLEVFERLHWAGTDTEGFAILGSFTQSDFARSRSGDRKPIYFAESGHRALLYAQQDWAGGETARALRHCFGDLDRFLESAEFRRKALIGSWRQLRSCVAGDVPVKFNPRSETEVTYGLLRSLWNYYSGQLGLRIGVISYSSGLEPVDYTEEWLRDQLRMLEPIRRRCDALKESFEHGVVYAVRMFDSDVNDLSHGPGGLAALKPIPADRIIAKAVIDKEARYTRLSRRGEGGMDRDTLARIKASEGDGVVARVEKKPVSQ